MDQRKDVSRAGAAGFAVVAGLWLISVLFVALPIALFANDSQNGSEELGPWFYIVFFGLVVPWTIAGPLFLTTKADEVWWQKKNGCREPDDAEKTRLDPLWDDVCSRAGLHPQAYELQMTDSQTINAFASGDSVVSMDRGLLTMDDGAISAVIAHELGHHTKRHIGGIVLAWWYGKPAQILLRLMIAVISGIMAVTRGSFGYFGLFVVIVLFGVLLIPLAALYLLMIGSTVLLRVLGRKTEFEADAYARELGLGPEMASALRQIEAKEPDEETGRFSADRLLATHPPLSDRIERLESKPQ